jgi:hypothetical protein
MNGTPGPVDAARVATVRRLFIASFRGRHRRDIDVDEGGRMEPSPDRGSERTP